jgi:hypothetical protein
VTDQPTDLDVETEHLAARQGREITRLRALVGDEDVPPEWSSVDRAEAIRQANEFHRWLQATVDEKERAYSLLLVSQEKYEAASQDAEHWRATAQDAQRRLEQWRKNIVRAEDAQVTAALLERINDVTEELARSLSRGHARDSRDVLNTYLRLLDHDEIPEPPVTESADWLSPCPRVSPATSLSCGLPDSRAQHTTAGHLARRGGTGFTKWPTDATDDERWGG